MSQRVLASAKKHHSTSAEQAQDKRAEDHVMQISVAMLDPNNPPPDLKLKNAKIEWRIVTEYLRTVNFYGDVDVASVIGYCNAVAHYKKAWRDMNGEPDVIETAKGQVINPKINVIEKWSKEMSSCMNRAGFSANARLGVGAKLVQQEQEQIKDKFGAI